VAGPGPTIAHRSRRLAATVAAAGIALALVAGCGSGTDKPALPGQSTTTSAEGSTSTTASRETTTTTAARTTTTTAARTTTTTTGDGPTTSTTSTSSTSTTVAPTTTTTRPATTTTTKPATTTSTEKATTTTAAAGTTTTSLPSDTIASGESDVPWLAIGALAAVLVLVLIVALRRRSERSAWWARADALVHDGRAVVDLGTSGPAGADPQQEIAHWGTIEQRTQALANEVQTVLGSGPPDDASRAALGGLAQAVADYLGALRTSRTLRIGPPAPTPNQIQYADAESNQRLAIVRANLDQLEQLVVPHRSTT